ncbi:50S ribosomal protein L22 [bacterium BMS3Abin02]|nr:50S ribosomal protein L22 [bacterium BMS3Abin02]GBE21259.1 50S ribosomal protein L22 [bacterium BMS3Bbin01]HDH25835.1 50S ribosomal protein L22 [Actinomycetota bacterium]HDL48773.1 50S ribosomal protein L22 [Actinomycetota bacterium]
MKVRAEAKYIRQSPYKVRRVLDLVRGLPVEEARNVLAFTDRRAADTVRKVLDSAVANAEHNHALDADELVVVEAYANEGPTLKRWRPRARGRATRILKRTSHITIVVTEESEA